MDAAIMDGATLDIGGVAAIRDVRHPVSVARSLLREIPVLLAGEGASRFAGQIGSERALPHPSADKDTNEDEIGRASCREEGVSTCRFRWSPLPLKKNNK